MTQSAGSVHVYLVLLTDMLTALVLQLLFGGQQLASQRRE